MNRDSGVPTLTAVQVRSFRRRIMRHYMLHGRDLPWRSTDDPYRILVSEIMLQQTQVTRVLVKYAEFLSRFPDFNSLANARLAEVLRVWQGLGYNRRAIALKRTAEEVVAYHNGILPADEKLLVALPGIGKATAGALAAFAFRKPSVFIETNSRRVYIHFFFEGRDDVRDAEIVPLIAATVDRADPRRWYYALMDYGVWLKTQTENPNRRSIHYRRQSRFEGSHRQLRGIVLKECMKGVCPSVSAIAKEIEIPRERVAQIVRELEKEGFIKRRGRRIEIA